MNALSNLRKQVRAAWRVEEKLEPEERELLSWQFVANQSGILYLVGKGGHNTFFYRVGDKDKVQYVMPDEMFALLDKWNSHRYVMYGIARDTIKSLDKARRTSRVLEKLLDRTDDKYSEHFIVGLRADGRIDRLYALKTGIHKNEWVALK